MATSQAPVAPGDRTDAAGTGAASNGNDPEGGLASRLHATQRDIVQACQAAGRDPAGVRLVAVSKRHPAAVIAAGLRLGQCDFGENYAQELRDKRAELGADPTVTDLLPRLRWHFIGPLQRNKVPLLAGRVALIHSIDSVELIQDLAGRLTRQAAHPTTAVGATQDILIQVNVGDESQKSGCSAADLPRLLEAVAVSQGWLRCVGLMCIPPASEDPQASRPHFRALRDLRDLHAATARPHVDLRELSMGMSHDFAVAIAEGATLVRVGTAIFGPR